MVETEDSDENMDPAPGDYGGNLKRMQAESGSNAGPDPSPPTSGTPTPEPPATGPPTPRPDGFAGHDLNDRKGTVVVVSGEQD